MLDFLKLGRKSFNISYSRHMKTLVDKGYKVARIEQVESPLQLKERNQNGSRDKCVRRELCNISTKGTLNCGVHGDIPHEDNFLMSVFINIEKIGLCFSNISKFLM